MRKDIIEMFQSLKNEMKEPGDLPDTLRRIALTANNYFTPDFCVIFPVNPVTRTFLREKPTVIGNLIKTTLEDFRIPREFGLTKLVLSKKVLFVEENLLPNFRTPIIDNEQIHSFTAFAMYTRRLQRPLAVLYLDYRKPNRFDEKFQSDLQTFVELASSELQNTWFIRRYREIAKIGQDINENIENIDRMFEKVYEHIKGILDVSYYFSLVKYNLYKNDAEILLVENGKKTDIRKNFPIEHSISSWVITNLITVKIDNIDNRNILPDGIQAIHIEGTETKEKALIFVPLKLNDRPLGVISVQHPEPNHYDEEDKQILELLANHVSLALNNARLLEDLQQLHSSGQILTQKLDANQDILNEVVHFIYKTTQSNLVILYPYFHGENKYFPSISRGTLLDQGSIKAATTDPTTIVHLINLRDKPIFAEDSTAFYSQLGIDYLNGTKFPDRENIQSTVAIPLKVRDEPIGVLFVNYRTRQMFDEAQKWVISSLATYAAIAIRNSRQFRELRLRRAKELEDLHSIDLEISRTLEADKILNTILDLTTQHLKADTGVILLHNKKTNAIEAKAIIGKNLLPLEQQVYPLDQFRGIAKTAFETKQSIRIDNVREEVKWRDKFSEISKSTISEMDIPLILDNEAIGVMNFESNREKAFNEDDQKFMETLAGQAVIAIKNVIDYARAQRVAKEREALIDIVNILISQTDPKEIFSIVLKKALEITETSKGAIKTCDEERRELKIIVASGIEKEEWLRRVQTFDEGIIGKVAREKRCIRIDNLSNHPLKKEYLKVFEGKIESELAVPILAGGRITGVINLESENPYHFEDDDTELIKSLASLCAIALKNVEIAHEKELASIGLITGDISHKMNSPLSKIQKQIELIEIGCEGLLESNNYLAEKIAQINTITSVTIQMVQKLMEQAKHSFAAVEKTSLKLILKKTLGEIEIPKNIKLEDKISESKEPVDVLATPELNNVFHNLITNAIQAMPDGGNAYINLEIMDENWVIISVEDTGKGIPENIAPLVYLPISDQGEEGHGFGLSLTKAYIEMIGGKIDTPIKGRDGKGTKFIVRFRTP